MKRNGLHDATRRLLLLAATLFLGGCGPAPVDDARDDGRVVAAGADLIFPRFAFVANEGDHTVAAYTVDASSGQLRSNGYVLTGKAPAALATDPGARFLYVANRGTNDISGYRVDRSTGRLSAMGATFAALSSPRALAVEPTGRYLYAATSGTNSVSGYAIDATSGALRPLATSPYKPGVDPRALAIVPSGAFVYVANAGSNTVSGFAILADGTLKDVAGSPFAAGSQPAALAVHPGGSFIYAANRGSGTVTSYRIDRTTGRLAAVGAPAATGAAPASIALDGDGTYAYVANEGAGSISAYRIDPATGALAPVAGSPFGTAASPAAVRVDATGRYVFAVHRTFDSVSAFTLDRASGALAPLPRHQRVIARRAPAALALTADTKPVRYTPKFAFAAGNSVATSYRIDAGSGELVSAGAPVAVDGSPISLGLHPTASLLYAPGHHGYAEIAALGFDASGTLSVLASSRFDSEYPSAVAIEPSGRFAFVQNGMAPHLATYRIDTASGALALRFDLPIGGSWPRMRVDPAGRFLYIVHEGISSTLVHGYSINPATGELTPLPGSPFPTAAWGETYSLAIDPDGRYVYVSHRNPGDRDSITIHYLNPTTGALRRVGFWSGRQLWRSALDIEPKGRFLYLTSEAEDVVHAFDVDAATGALNPVAGSPYPATDPVALAADASGRFVYVASERTNSLLAFSIDDRRGALAPVFRSPFFAGHRLTAVAVGGVVQ